FSGSQVERDFLEWRRQGAAVDPAPIAAKITGAVFGINLRHALEFGSVNQLAQYLLRHCLLSRRIGRAGWDHDHAQFNLFLAGELGSMLAIVILNPVR